MTGLFRKLAAYAADSAEKRGAYVLFALVMPVERPHGWDLLVSADWMRGSTRDEIERISSELDEYLSIDEKLELSRIVVLDPDNPVAAQLSGVPATRSPDANPTRKGFDLDNATQADVVILASKPAPTESLFAVS
jgi:hypothetical protein